MTTKARNTAFSILGIILISFNLRPAITVVGPLSNHIRLDLDIPSSIIGLLTTLPILAFAVISPVAPKLGDRWGNKKVTLLGLIVLFTGIILRSLGSGIMLFAGTIFIGCGIGIANVLLPSLIKEMYPAKIGLLTGIYTTCLVAFAALGSGLAVPLGKRIGWQNTLLLWAFLAAMAILVWSPLAVHDRKGIKMGRKDQMHNREISRLIWKSSLAWQVTLFMGFQSFLFYATIAWFPDVFSSLGITPEWSGWLVFIMQICGLPATLLTPIFAGRMASQQGIMLSLGGLNIAGFLGLIFSRHIAVITVCVLLIGIAQGISISLFFALLGFRTNNGEEAAVLSGMSQSVGYVLAAVGPFLLGYCFDLTRAWTIPLIILIIVSVLMTITGLAAGRNEKVVTPSH